MASVAVIIPTFNHWQFLRDAMASVHAQTKSVSEIVVVDDGSDTPCPFDLGPDVVLIRQCNAGPSVARNRALAEVTTDFVVPLDADNELMPTFVEQTLAAWRRSPRRLRVGVTYTPALTARGVMHVGLLTRRTLAPHNSIDQCALIRREALLDVGGWAEELSREGSEDWDLWLSLAERGWLGKIHPEPLYRYHDRGGPSRNDMAVANVDQVLEIINRRHPWRLTMDAPSLPERVTLRAREWASSKRQSRRDPPRL